MQLSPLLLALAIMLTAAGCKKNETGTVALKVVGNYGSQPLLMYQEYDYADGMKVLFQRYQFYLSDIELVAEDGSSVLLSEIELIDFSEIQDATSAAEGVRINFREEVPVKSYTALRMGIGVSPALNATNPANYELGHPLSDNYWSAALGYIFSKIEGKADTTGSAGFTTDLTFHTGSNELYTTIELSADFRVMKDQTLELPLRADLRRVLVNENGDFLDFRKYSIDHHINPEVYNFIGLNLPECLEVKN